MVTQLTVGCQRFIRKKLAAKLSQWTRGRFTHLNVNVQALTDDAVMQATTCNYTSRCEPFMLLLLRVH